MLASNNILSPATGRPIITPSQDMVLGCYYLTADNPYQQKGAGSTYSSMEDAVLAFEQGLIDLHAEVWLRFDGPVDTFAKEELIEESHEPDGTVRRIYSHRRVREDADGNLISQYIKTTTGRIIYNKAVHDALAS